MDIRAKFERAWKNPLPPAQSLSSTLMLEGGIRWLYILGEGPAQTDADSNQVRHPPIAGLSDRAGDISHRDHELRPVVLPTASFAECDGTFTNGERRIQRLTKAIPPLYGRENWQATCLD
jgi:formate dehydrogenase alpha subunit